jgi:hypothetical protein
MPLPVAREIHRRLVRERQRGHAVDLLAVGKTPVILPPRRFLRKKESEASITMKLKRGTFPAAFFLACIAALDLAGVTLEDI